MKRRRSAWKLLTTAVLVTGAACSTLTDPASDSAAGSELTFVRVAAGAPSIASTEVSFWAVRGQDREVQIRYYYADTHQFAKCLRFVVPAQALQQRPDGTPIAVGDSVQITIRMPDPGQFVFVFDPGGLRFDPAHPATVEVVYRYADRDFNGDGVIDARDAPIQARFGFWRQERPDEPWYRVATTRLEDVAEARARITGFTKYALASE